MGTWGHGDSGSQQGQQLGWQMGTWGHGDSGSQQGQQLGWQMGTWGHGDSGSQRGHGDSWGQPDRDGDNLRTARQSMGASGDTRIGDRDIWGHLGHGGTWGHPDQNGDTWGHTDMAWGQLRTLRGQGHLGTHRTQGHLGTPGQGMGTLGDTQTGQGDIWGHLGRVWGHLGTPGQDMGTLGDRDTRDAWGCPQDVRGVPKGVPPPPNPIHPHWRHPGVTRGHPWVLGVSPKAPGSLSPVVTSPKVLHLGWDPFLGAGGHPGMDGTPMGAGDPPGTQGTPVGAGGHPGDSCGCWRSPKDTQGVPWVLGVPQGCKGHPRLLGVTQETPKGAGGHPRDTGDNRGC